MSARNGTNRSRHLPAAFRRALTPGQVNRIREKYRKDKGRTRARQNSYRALAEEFGVSPSTVRNVVQRWGSYAKREAAR